MYELKVMRGFKTIAAARLDFYDVDYDDQDEIRELLLKMEMATNVEVPELRVHISERSPDGT